MDTASIAAIYDTIKYANGQFCSICFRPSSEQKLVQPVFLIKLPNFHRKGATKKKSIKVCYMCEAMAARVMKFQQAVNLAESVEVVLSYMTDELRDALVDSHKIQRKGISTTIRQIKEIEDNIRKAKIPRLSSSTVLLVGSEPPVKPCTTLDYTSPNTRPISASFVGATTNSTRPFGTSHNGSIINTSFVGAGTNVIMPVGITFIGTSQNVINPVSTSFVGSNTNVTMPVGISSIGTSQSITKPVSTSFVGSNTNVTRSVGASFDGISSSVVRHVGTGPSGTRSVGNRIVSNSPDGTRTDNTTDPIFVDDSPPPRQSDKNKEKSLIRVTSDPGQLQFQVKDKKTGKVMLYPMVKGTDGKLYVPSLKVQVVNNDNIKSVSDLDLFNYANVPLPAIKPKMSVEKKKPVIIATYGKQEGTKMIDNFYEFIKRQPIQNENGDEKLEDDSSVDPLSNNNKKARLEIEDPLAQNGSGGVEDGTGGAMEQAYAVTDAAKPVLRMDKVLDWEDKIPMDIISFMDATDPNPNERIMQPNLPPSPKMGVISDVRTVGDKEDEFITSANPVYVMVSNNESFVDSVNDVQFVNVNSVNNDEDIDNDVQVVENIECIDLC